MLKPSGIRTGFSPVTTVKSCCQKCRISIVYTLMVISYEGPGPGVTLTLMMMKNENTDKRDIFDNELDLLPSLLRWRRLCYDVRMSPHCFLELNQI
jgi:hypothetical protein